MKLMSRAASAFAAAFTCGSPPSTTSSPGGICVGLGIFVGTWSESGEAPSDGLTHGCQIVLMIGNGVLAIFGLRRNRILKDHNRRCEVGALMARDIDALDRRGASGRSRYSCSCWSAWLRAVRSPARRSLCTASDSRAF